MRRVALETPSFSTNKFESYHNEGARSKTGLAQATYTGSVRESNSAAHHLQSSTPAYYLSHWGQAGDAYSKQDSSLFLNISNIQAAEKTSNKSNLSNSARHDTSMQITLNPQENQVYQPHDLGPNTQNFSGVSFKARKFPNQTQPNKYGFLESKQHVQKSTFRSQSQKHLLPQVENQIPSSTNLSHLSNLGAVSRSTRESYNTTLTKNLQDSVYVAQPKIEQQLPIMNEDNHTRSKQPLHHRSFHSRTKSQSKLLHRKKKSFAEDLPGFLGSHRSALFRDLSYYNAGDENNGDSRVSSDDDETSKHLKVARIRMQNSTSQPHSQNNLDPFENKEEDGTKQIPKSNHMRSLSYPEKLLSEHRTLSSNYASRTNLLANPDSQQKQVMSNIFSHTKVSRYGPHNYLELRKSYASGQQDQRSTDGNESFSHSLPRTASQPEGIFNASQNPTQEHPLIFIIPARKSDPNPSRKPPLISRKDSSLLKPEPLEVVLQRNSYEKERIELSNITMKKLDFTLEEEEEDQGVSSENVSSQKQRKYLPPALRKEHPSKNSSSNASPQRVMSSSQLLQSEQRHQLELLDESLKSMQGSQIQFYGNDSNLYESEQRIITDPIENYRFTAEDGSYAEEESKLGQAFKMDDPGEPAAYKFENQLLARIQANKDPHQLRHHYELQPEPTKSHEEKTKIHYSFKNEKHGEEYGDYEMVHKPIARVYERNYGIRLNDNEPANNYPTLIARQFHTGGNKKQLDSIRTDSTAQINKLDQRFGTRVQGPSSQIQPQTLSLQKQLSYTKFEIEMSPESSGYEEKKALLQLKTDSHIQKFIDSRIQQHKEQEELRMKIKKGILSQLFLQQESTQSELSTRTYYESGTKVSSELNSVKQSQFVRQPYKSVGLDRSAMDSQGDFPVVHNRNSQLFTNLESGFKPNDQNYRNEGNDKRPIISSKDNQSREVKQIKNVKAANTELTPQLLYYSSQQSYEPSINYPHLAYQSYDRIIAPHNKAAALRFKSLRNPSISDEVFPQQFQSVRGLGYPLDNQDTKPLQRFSLESSNLDRRASIEDSESIRLSKVAGSPFGRKQAVSDKPLMSSNQKKLIAYKPTNKQLIKNAITYVCLPGESSRSERERIFQKIEEIRADNFIILFAGVLSRQDFGGLYSFDSSTGVVKCIYSTTSVPTTLTPYMVHSYYRYDSGLKEFKEIPSNKNFSIAVDAIVLFPSILKQYSNVNIR